MEVVYPLGYSPDFIEGLVFTPTDTPGEVKITVRKTNGSDYGSVTMTRERLIATLDLLQP